jgi:hypothetical protein
MLTILMPRLSSDCDEAPVWRGQPDQVASWLQHPCVNCTILWLIVIWPLCPCQRRFAHSMCFQHADIEKHKDQTVNEVIGTHWWFEQFEFLLFGLLILLYLLPSFCARILELLNTVCDEELGSMKLLSHLMRLNAHWRACWTILAASFSASSSVWMPCDCWAAFREPISLGYHPSLKQTKLAHHCIYCMYEVRQTVSKSAPALVCQIFLCNSKLVVGLHAQLCNSNLSGWQGTQ